MQRAAAGTKANDHHAREANHALSLEGVYKGTIATEDCIIEPAVVEA
jgi:hypothetical protein